MSTVIDPGSHKSAVGRGPAETPRIAMIGCGAIAERYHLPALGQHSDVMNRVVLVDSNPERTAELGQMFGVQESVLDYRDVLDDLDGAIVATPPASHMAICSDLLDRGISVLCEKPLVERSEDARELLSLADSNGVAVCMNHTRRMYPTNSRIREFIQSGDLGTLRSIEYVDGGAFSWPTSTGFHFQAGAPGVLFDLGSHSLDLICWWLGAKPDLKRSLNDSHGGPESVAWLQLGHEECDIKLRLSWLSRLQNYYRISGDLGTVEGRVDQWDSLRLTRPSGRVETIRATSEAFGYNDFGKTIVSNFLEVLRGKADPLVPAGGVVDSLELIEEAYRSASRLQASWTFGEA